MKHPIASKSTGQLKIQVGIKKISKVLSNNIHPIPSNIKPTRAFPDF
jgi:hypothetical protein